MLRRRGGPRLCRLGPDPFPGQEASSSRSLPGDQVTLAFLLAIAPGVPTSGVPKIGWAAIGFGRQWRSPLLVLEAFGSTAASFLFSLASLDIKFPCNASSVLAENRDDTRRRLAGFLLDDLGRPSPHRQGVQPVRF